LVLFDLCGPKDVDESSLIYMHPQSLTTANLQHYAFQKGETSFPKGSSFQFSGFNQPALRQPSRMVLTEREAGDFQQHMDRLSLEGEEDPKIFSAWVFSIYNDPARTSRQEIRNLGVKVHVPLHVANLSESSRSWFIQMD